MTTKTIPGASDVEVTIVGMTGAETVTLKASLQACIAISREGGGIYGANSLSDRLTRFDIDAYVTIVRAGLGLTGNAVPDLAERVFRTGMVNLTKPLTKFVIGLGDPEKRRPADEGEGDAPLSLEAAAAAAGPGTPET